MLTTSPRLLLPDPPHYAWDNSIAPRLVVQDGEAITFQTRDAADLHFRVDSTTADLATYEFRGHPLTGPVMIEGARPGAVLQVDVLEHTYAVSREDAYCLASVAVDLKISEVVDAPNWIVSAFLPLSIIS